MALIIVTGPPGAGKSTHVRQHRKPGDVTIDYDTLANALSGLDPDNHEHEPHIKAITKAARQAAIDKAAEHPGDHNVWIIHSSPSAKLLDHYRNLSAEVVTVDPGKAVVMKRVKAERPAHMLRIAALWYEPDPAAKRHKAKGRDERGYGLPHKRQRESLVRTHKDGTPCWWCNLPMYGDRNKTKNWDNKALAADHGDESARTGGHANRLLHFTCNSQRGNGTNDHLRPIVTGQHPSEPLPTQASKKATQVAAGFNFGGVTFD